MKKVINYLLVIVLATSCTESKMFTDSQGNEYPIVEIDGKIWLAENLKLQVDSSFCYENNNAECDTMGRLYTWEAAVVAAKMIPGWRLPTKNEWESLIEKYGTDSLGYNTIVSQELGFNLHSAGVRLANGKYVAKRFKGVNYWSSTECDTSNVLAYSVALMTHIKKISPHNYPKNNACSVRLIKDN